MTDVELLEKHRQGSESAFADLVRRHLGWVCGLARRRLRDEHRAEDVAQAVFVLLHRKAPVFATDGAMIGWLHKAAWYAAETAARDERRRVKRETAAAELQAMTKDESDVEWRQLAPVLDELVGRLSRSDREAILLRYYRDLSFAEVAEQIRTTPDAARKRMERAIEKLRSLARGKGLTLSAAVLPALLAAHVKMIPPPGLVATATVTATAQAGSALALTTGGIVKGAIIAMATAKATLAGAAIIAVLLVAGGAAFVTSMYVSGNSQPQVMVIANSMPTIQTGPTLSKTRPSPTARGMTPIFHLATGGASPFQAIRWPGTTPEVLVNGTWYQLLKVDGVSIDQIIRFCIQRHEVPISCYQEQVENDMLHCVSLIKGGAISVMSGDLEVKDLTTGQVQTLPNVRATQANFDAISKGRSERGQARPKSVLDDAISEMQANRTDQVVAAFAPLDAAQRARLLGALAYPIQCLQFNDEIAKKFNHTQIGEADHILKPFWWLPDLNEIDTLDSAMIDLRSLGLGQMTMHRIDGAWKIDPAWITENAEGLDRINGFLPNLLAFKRRFEAGEFTTGQQLAEGLDAMAGQFDAMIPDPPQQP